MGKTILRVLDGTVLSSELSSKLEELLPGYTLETFHAKPDYERSIKRRIESLHAAFLFLLDAYPLDPKFTNLTKSTLITYADNARASCALINRHELIAANTLELLHKELEQFVGALVSAIKISWQWPHSTKDPIACLNEAEQYLLMKQGRPHIATLTPMDFGNRQEFVLQVDESLPPYYEQWIDELTKIKADDASHIPVWFMGLRPAEQAYLCHFVGAQSTLNAEEMISDLSSLLGLLQKLKSNDYWGQDLALIHKQRLPLPDWFNKLNKAQQEMIRILAETPAYIEESINAFKTFLMEKNTNVLFVSELNRVANLPQWYLLLPRYQQAFLKHVIKDAVRIEEVVSFLPSRHRTLPAPANFGAHQLIRIDDQGSMQPLSTKRYRSSHVVSRDLIKAQLPEAVQQRNSDSNLQQVMRYAGDQQIRLLQTLISPLPMGDFIPSSLMHELPPDTELYQQARTTVMRNPHGKRTVQTNHPFNYAKFIFYTEPTNSDSQNLIEQMQQTVLSIDNLARVIAEKEGELNSFNKQLELQKSPSSKRNKAKKSALTEKIVSFTKELSERKEQWTVLDEQKRELLQLLSDYQNVLNSSLGTATILDYQGRELFLSSLEHLLVLSQGGYSYGSCVSGKDRKAIELLHTDAMLIYKQRYGAWPKYTDVDLSRERFVSIVADLYLSRHQHELAGQNAPGSEGIKTPLLYLPKDICSEINRRLGYDGLDHDDRLATNNEVKNIFGNLTEVLTPEKELKSLLIAAQLGELLCTKLYNALFALINEKRLFQVPKTTEWARSLNFLDRDSSHLPSGIEAIRRLMHNEHEGNNVQRLAKIIQIVLGRAEKGARKPATVAVYGGVRRLCHPLPDGASLESSVEDIIKKWREHFEASKIENASTSSTSTSDEELSSGSPVCASTH